MAVVFDYLEKNNLTTTSKYPNTHKDGTCKDNTGTGVVGVSSYYLTHGKTGSPQTLMSYIATRPTAISICAKSNAFNYYKGGVLTSSACGTCADHAVLAVGYGTDAQTGLDYWKIKNSWGVTWGEGGYIRVLKQSGRSAGTCGVLKEMTYPLINI